MGTLTKTLTIFVMALSFLSCSSEEDIGFDLEPAFTKTIGKVEADRATLVMAIDDSASMISKVNELSGHLNGMFTDLVSAGWDIDLHVVTCAFHKSNASMKSASTLSVANKNDYAQKVRVLMEEASPTIDLSTITNDADERCNQSLEKAWQQIQLKNKVNLSMIISNEDGCARSDSNNTIKDINGASRGNCAPVTWGRVTAHSGLKLMDQELDVWEKAVGDYSEKVWIPGFRRHMEPSLTPVNHYVNFFQNLEVEGKKQVPNFSHIYLPVVVDSNKCLAQTLKNQALKEREDYVSKNNGDPQGFDRPKNTVANIGYSYLATFDELKQENILFSKEEGDLSICDDLSHVVSKIQREIKLRGQSVRLNLTRPINVEVMKNLYPNDPIARVIRPIESAPSEAFFQERNVVLEPMGVKWVKISDTEYAIDLYLNSPMVEYYPNEPSLLIINTQALTVTSGDTVVRHQYMPEGFREKDDAIIYNGE